jgi:phage replication-related protein YjqB (UPF0714/DUF867 family)
MMHIDRYRSYSELAKHEVEGTDFTITVFRRPFSAVAVIAIHGCVGHDERALIGGLVRRIV